MAEGKPAPLAEPVRPGFIIATAAAVILSLGLLALLSIDKKPEPDQFQETVKIETKIWTPPDLDNTGIRLRAIYTGSSGGKVAVLEDPGSLEQRILMEGMKIGSAEIVSISNNRVVLAEKGVQQSLSPQPVQDIFAGLDLPALSHHPYLLFPENII